MKKFIPFEKLSKSKQRELNKKKRGTWGALNPVTRKPQNPKKYNRKKAQQRKDDFQTVEPFALQVMKWRRCHNFETVNGKLLFAALLCRDKRALFLLY